MDEKMKSEVRKISTDVWNELEAKEDASKGGHMYGQESTVYSQSPGGYGYGGMGGFAPFGFIGAVGLNDVFGRRGDTDCLDQRITDLQIAGVNQNINSAESNLTQATLMQTNNLGQLILDGNNGLTNTVRTVGDVLAAQSAGVKDSVQAVQFQNSLQTKDLLEAGNANTQAILNKLCDQETQALRDALQDEKTARQFAERGLLTATGPAMSVIPNRCPESETADVVNQVNVLLQNGLSNIASQMPGLVATEVAKYTTK